MIKEAYCSFEIAKLLKKKGFDIPCYGRYSVRSQEFHLDTTRPCNNGGISQYSAPTLQMAMRWLREEYNIFINIDVIPYTTSTMEQRYYFYKIYKNRRPINFPPQKEDLQFYDTPEETIEAGIKFSLENLI